MITDALVPLFVVGMAELGDKTQVAILLLSSRTKRQLHLLLGVVLAFLVVDGFAVFFGSGIINLVPTHLLKIFSGIIFIMLGVLVLRHDDGEQKEHRSYYKNSLFSGFFVVFMAEWGDKTQIAAAMFATKYDAWMVLLGCMTALTLLSVMAIYLGKFILDKVNPKLMTKIAGAVFILTGMSFFLA